MTPLCELPDFEVRHEIQTDTRLAYRVAFAPDEQKIACVGYDRQVKLFDVETEQLVAELERTSGFMTLITFSPDGQRILTGGLDGKLRIWMIESGEQLLALDIRPRPGEGRDNTFDRRRRAQVILRTTRFADTERGHQSSPFPRKESRP